jgi:DNA-binding beta-propeller fold protein YncE
MNIVYFMYMKNFKNNVLQVSAFLIVCLGLCFPSYANALISNGANAVDGLGQYDGTYDGVIITDFVPSYTKSSTNNGIDRFGLTPNGVVVDPINHRLFITDNPNHRVLVYELNASNQLVNHIPINVLGQSTFTSGTSATTKAGLATPVGLAYDATNQRLFVSQTGAHRVSVFDVTSITNGEDAINVIGQDVFTTGGAVVDIDGLNSPMSVAYDSGTKYLYVGQATGQRVTIFNADPTVLIPNDSLTDGPDALFVLGQAGFGSSTISVTAAGFSGGGGMQLALDETGDRLFVSQTTSNRVSVFDISTITNGESAIAVLGQSNFTSSAGATTIAGLNGSSGVAFDSANNRLFVSQTTSNRVSVFDVLAITNGENAVNVIGQANFTTGASTLTQAGMAGAGGIFFDSTSNNLYVSQSTGRRISIFNAGIATLIPNDTLTDGPLAIDLIGQTNGLYSIHTPIYTKNGLNDSPNGIGLNLPYDIALDSVDHRLFVADHNGNRVLVFNLNGSNQLLDHVPDLVIGQPNFYTNTGALSATGLTAPRALAYDEVHKRLFVGQGASANRVTVYDATPGILTNGASAINVIGQPDLLTGTVGTTIAKINTSAGSISLAYDPIDDRLFVAQGGNRVTVYDTDPAVLVPNTFVGPNAINVIGQENFTSSLATVDIDGVSNPTGVVYDTANKRLFVAQTGANRVTVYNADPAVLIPNDPLSDGPDAINLIGQTSFLGSTALLNQLGLSGPTGLVYDDTTGALFVSSRGYNRVTVFNAHPTVLIANDASTNGKNAHYVLGQSDYTTSASSTTQSSTTSPGGLVLDRTNNRLYVTQESHRVSVFDAAMVAFTPAVAPNLDALSDTGSSSTDNITDDTTPTFTGSCINGQTVTIKVDGVAVLPTVLCAGSAYSITLSTPLVEGTYSITSMFTNAHGDSGNSPTLNLQVDTDGPVFSSVNINPQGGNTFEEPALTFSATDNHSLTITYTVSIDGGPFGAYVSGTQVPTLVPADPHHIIVRACDEFNHCTDEDIYFYPAVSIVSPTIVKNTSINDITIDVIEPSGSANTLATVSATVSFNGGGATPITITCVPAVPGTGTKTSTCTLDTPIGPAAGQYELVAMATNNAGIPGTGETSRIFIIETNVPTVNSTIPTTLSNTDIVDTFIEVSDDYGIDSVVLGGTASADIDSCTPDLPYTGTGIVECRINVRSSGTVTMTVTDLAGNTNTTFSQAYIIETEVPDVTINAPTTASTGPITDTTITLSDENGIANIAIGGATLDSCTPALPYTGSGNVVCDVTVSATGTLAIEVLDRAGNLNDSESQSYTIETDSPTVSGTVLTTLSNSAITNTTITVSDASGIQSVALDNGATVTSCTPALPYTGTSNVVCNISIPATGTYTATVTDRAGNTNTTFSQAYIIETTPPTVTSSVPTITAKNTPIIDTTLTLSDANGIQSLTMSGATVTSCTPVLPYTGSGNVICAITVTSSGTVTATVTDRAGNTDTTFSQAYTISRPSSGGSVPKTPPVVTPVTPPVTAPITPQIPPTAPKDENTQCTLITSTLIFPSRPNNAQDVNTIITFLNTYENEKLALDGTYDQDDIAAINRFQNKYRAEILSPWGGTTPTGIVGNYTRAKMSVMQCAQFAGCPYFTENARLGATGGDVKKIQNFLNVLLGKNLQEASFTPVVASAVREYQSIYRESVLRPLGLTTPTGNWFQFSRQTANKLMGCI